MRPSEFSKRTVYFAVSGGIFVIMLILIPIIENVVREYILGQFALSVSADGEVVAVSGEAPGLMTTTTIRLIVNLFLIAKIILWMALVISFVRFITFLIFTTALRHTTQSEIVSLLKTVVSIVVYIVAFFIVFQSQYPNVQLAPLFTGSTILGIVVGLALQDTLGNLFAGIALQADQPFQVGDVISMSDGKDGVVEAVSWRGIKIRTFQDKLVVMSNSVMGKESVEVAPRDNLNARLVSFNTFYSASPSRTIQLVRDTVRQIPNVSPKIRPIVRIRQLGLNSVEWEVKYWPENYRKFNDTDALIRERIWYLFHRERIEFAHPVQTLHLESRGSTQTTDDYLSFTAERLLSIPIFSALSTDEIDLLANASRDRVFAPGEAIVNQGNEGNSMFVIIRGSVKVEILVGEQRKSIGVLRESDYFGEMSLLTGEPRTATVTAVEETEVIQINKTALKPIFEANPELVSMVYESIEERRALLRAEAENPVSKDVVEKTNVLRSIRRFFGLG